MIDCVIYLNSEFKPSVGGADTYNHHPSPNKINHTGSRRIENDSSMSCIFFKGVIYR